jgi:hypothetical protein|tara:strand:+ start:90 stop:284 length:195 start_codon:yes stop_codon:yes gene_type:complete
MNKVKLTEDSEYIRLFGDDDDSEEFIESVYKQEMGENFEKIENGVGIGTYKEIQNNLRNVDKKI